MSEWTKEPWTVGGSMVKTGHVFKGSRLIAGCQGHSESHNLRAVDENDANAERIVACVNACAGIRDPAEAIEKAKKALTDLGNWHDDGCDRTHGGTRCDCPQKDRQEMARAALAALENE